MICSASSIGPATKHLSLIASHPYPYLTRPPDLPGIRHALAATRHLLEMYRRQLSNDKASRRLQRLDRRLLDVDQALQNIAAAQK